MSLPLPPTPPPTTDSTLLRTLDAAALARLHDLDPDGQHGVVQRVLQAFDQSLSRMLGQLAAERERHDVAVVATVAHTLKSSAASVGALQLAEACAGFEQRQRSGDGSSSLHADIEQLHREGEAALLAVRAMLRA